MKIQDILDKYDLTFEELRPDERETLYTWLRVINEGALTLQKVKTYIASMRDAVEQELTDVKNIKRSGSFLLYLFFYRNRDLMLKARLRNYMLLEAFLSTPEKAKEALDRAMAGIAKPKKK